MLCLGRIAETLQQQLQQLDRLRAAVPAAHVEMAIEEVSAILDAFPVDLAPLETRSDRCQTHVNDLDGGNQDGCDIRTFPPKSSR